MEVVISSCEKSEYGFYVVAECGKVSANVNVYPHSLNVCVKNASHKVWKSGGNLFGGVADALKHYKSSEVKAIIVHVDAYVASLSGAMA